MSSTVAGAGAHGHDASHAEDGSVSGFLRTYVFSIDHKIIGIQFLFSTLLWFVVGGLLALAVRWQLAWPWSNMPVVGRMLFSGEGGQISPEFYTMLVTMHATVMIFFVIIPILAGAFGNFLIPLMIGADDMAFPTLNMLSYWFMWPAFICMTMSFFVEGGAAAAVGRRIRRYPRPPKAAPGSGTGQTLVVAGGHLCRRVVDDGLGQLHDHHHPDACAGHDHVPLADDHLGHVHHRRATGLCTCRC